MKNKKPVMISIKGLPFFSHNENDVYELMTDGEYLQTDDMSTFSYYESNLTGFDGILTTFNVENDSITLRRGDGTIGNDMIFSENQKHHFLYNTPVGAVMLGIDTHKITKDMDDDGGNIEIRYDIEVDNITVSKNMFKINIRSLPQ
ncbi:MAG: DUF1934 domain-containing protein [Oscillospiraceae bacterium]|nr:DUF1934 domain-containing protein [Oscillospiraceae bacterium]